MDHSSISKNLVYQRKLKGFTQEELAERTQVTVRTIQRIEKGDVNPHLQTVKLLAAALDVDVDDLLPLEDPKEEAVTTKWLLLLHGSPLIGFVIPLFNVLIPLFLWIHKRDDNPIYDLHGKKVVNFQITVLLAYVLSFIMLVTVEGFGFFAFILVLPFCVITVLVNVIYVVNSHKCYYPAIPFLRIKKSRKIMTALFLVFMGLTGCKMQSQEIIRLDGTAITQDSLSRKLHQLAEDAHIQGMGVAVFNDGKPVFKEVLGYKNLPENEKLTDTTNMYGASLSKAVFGVLVMKLVEEKVIDLDTPLESYLPKKIYEYEPQTEWQDDYDDLKADTLYHKITARMCLSHTTGFINWRWYEPDRKLRVHGKPGEKFVYSGEGMVYLQTVLEKLTGKGLEQVAQEKIFKPLGMKNTSYRFLPRFNNDFAYGHKADGSVYPKDKDNEARAPSTLETTVEDYIKFLTAVLHQELITKESYDEMFSPQIRIKTKSQFNEGAKILTDAHDDINLSYGLGWGYLDTPYGKGVFKEGGGDGFIHYSILFPETGKGILIMTNSANSRGIFKELLDVGMKDVYTPWEWENYIPYQMKQENN
ncbi:MAG: XRE family transcriptional regulator [Cytophagaceae bacterium]|nr:XRE family transcriptional regulator [Cytophagaceae bacterium]|tara:strand:+ start:1167 stop:2927 length:1761 start_codon:yes stop_codon:yes gene_type:complete